MAILHPAPTRASHSTILSLRCATGCRLRPSSDTREMRPPVVNHAAVGHPPGPSRNVTVGPSFDASGNALGLVLMLRNAAAGVGQRPASAPSREKIRIGWDGSFRLFGRLAAS